MYHNYLHGFLFKFHRIENLSNSCKIHEIDFLFSMKNAPFS
ncbi:hypothetical protein CLOSTMETH_03088 [[Clostridium] methylpentosum DSM 5476]|uniref:Uncharacterized protein n=1 Tax=[Clostridium] methylpentosum DSM 5476 TaxID=537013 RepID=C0EGU5_9FIRM|nr:hypothetical protein CLOSTMETH_03088 [[Clostridium] methylpentosum DSM 5476]